MRILLVNGPNLNLLGAREPEIYGRTTLSDIVSSVRGRCAGAGAELLDFQSNHEGALIDFLHAHREADGLILNAGGLTHTSVALRDAVKGTGLATVEVHLSNVHAREEFRHRSLLSAVAVGVIAGLGPSGYDLAADFLLRRTKTNP